MACYKDVSLQSWVGVTVQVVSIKGRIGLVTRKAGFIGSGFPGRGRRSCLAAVVRWDGGTNIGFGIGCRGEHISSNFNPCSAIFGGKCFVLKKNRKRIPDPGNYLLGCL